MGASRSVSWKQAWVERKAVMMMFPAFVPYSTHVLRVLLYMYVRVLVELWILTYNVALDTQEVVKNVITIESTFICLVRRVIYAGCMCMYQYH